MQGDVRMGAMQCRLKTLTVQHLGDTQLNTGTQHEASQRQTTCSRAVGDAQHRHWRGKADCDADWLLILCSAGPM